MSLEMLNPQLLSSYAIVSLESVPDGTPPELATDLEGMLDADLPEGTHLRLMPSSTLGLPLAPWMLWRVEAFPTPPNEGLGLYFAWEGAQVVGDEIRPDPGRTEVVGHLAKQWPQNLRLLAVEVESGDVQSLALLTPKSYRLAAVRTRPPLCVSGPEIAHLRVRASGPFRLRGWSIHEEQLRGLSGRVPDARLGGPALRGRWYAGDPNLEDPWDRVRRGAPRRRTPVDQPSGALSRWPDPVAAEVARVQTFANDLVETFRQMAEKDRVVPMKQKYSPPDAKGLATLNPMRTLLLQSLDPGAARLLGLMDTLKSGSPAEGAEHDRRTCWVSGAAFLRPEADTSPREDWLPARINELTPGFGDLLVDLKAQELEVRGYLTVAFVAPPPNPPELTSVVLDGAEWIRQGDGPGNLFRQGFRMNDPPLAVLAALARREGSVWQSRNALLPPTDRRIPLLVGMPKPGGTPLPKEPHYARLYDGTVPGEGTPWRYRIALGDLFGRFGPTRDVTVPAPPRPPVPRPVVETRTVPREAVPAGTAPASPGALELAIAIPATDELPAGSHSLETVFVNGIPGVPKTQRPAKAGRLELSFPLPKCAPSPSNQQRKSFDVNVSFEDVTGREGAPYTVNIVAVDPRPPAVPDTAAGLLWTSRPGPSSEVELSLHFPAPGGTRWRVYITDLNALRPGRSIPSDRAVAADLGRKITQADRDKFRLLTPAPVIAEQGELAFDTTLPRALRAVQFLRFVPINEHGVEATFTACPMLPVAVPSDRRPPAPRVSIEPDGSRVTMTIIAEGLDEQALREAEPGLFKKTPADDALPPEFRVRRASGAVAEPIYAREITPRQEDAGGRGRLTWNQAARRFEATFSDKNIKQYVRYFYWAEVRLPAERRLRRGAADVPFPAGAIRPEDPTQLKDAPAEFSEPSPAATAMVVPPNVPALKASQVTASYADLGGSWRLEIIVAGGPTTSPLAIGKFVVQAYAQAGDGDLTAAGSAPLVNGEATLLVDSAGDSPPQVRVGLVLVDPIGRTSALLLKAAQRR